MINTNLTYVIARDPNMFISAGTASQIGLYLYGSPAIAVAHREDKWRCGYCQMILSVSELNCSYCGAPGDVDRK